MSVLPDLLAGVYRHYKGPLYLVLGYGRDANQDGRTVVVYVGLELTGSARPGARINVRDVDDFHAVVDPSTGRALDWKEASDNTPRRFTYVGPDWQPPAPVAGAEYRLVRPDGVVLYTEMVADGPTHVAGEHWPPNTPVGSANRWWLSDRPTDYVEAPFRWQGRRLGTTDWVTLVESDPWP